MKINYIVLEGFKLFKEKTKIDLHKKTLIKADNFHGKTSIAEAIAYGFCGISLNGESRNTEDLINHDCDEMRVEINFNDDNNNNHTLVRVKNKKSQSVFLNEEEEPTTQNIINSFIGDPKLFLSCFNLSFFQNELEDSERRDIISQYTPTIDMVKLFGEMAPSHLIDKYNIQTHKTTEYSRINKLKKQTDEAIKEIEVKINVLTEQNKADEDVASEFISVDSDSEKTLKEKLEEMHNMHIQNTQVQAEYDIYNKKIVEYNNNVERAKALKEEFENINNTPISTYYRDTDEYNNRDNELRELGEKIASISLDKICKSCGNELTSEQLDKNIKDSETLKTLYNTLKEEIQSKLASDKNIEIENQNIMQKKASIQSEVNVIINQLKEAPVKPEKGLFDLSSYEDLKKEYEELVTKNKEISLKNAEVSNKINSINARVEELSQLNSHKKSLEEQSEELGSALVALSPSTGIFRKSLEAKSNFIKSELENCSIVLERMQKNGEIKECFEIFFKDTPYRRLSYSEEITCGLEIARFLRDQSKKRFPIFVDNSESISEISNSLLDSDQVIYCLVTPKSKLEILEIK